MGSKLFSYENMFMYHLCNLKGPEVAGRERVNEQDPSKMSKEKGFACGFYEQYYFRFALISPFCCRWLYNLSF